MSKRHAAASWLPQSPDLELVVYVDGSSVPNPGPSGIGLLVLARTSWGATLHGCTRNIGHAGNNVTEFLGLVDAVDLVRGGGAKRALIVSDSTVALNLVTGKTPAQPGEYAQMQRRVATWLVQNSHVHLCWVERKRNLAHHLARSAADLQPGEEHVTLLGEHPAVVKLAS